ncbi:MAG: prenyltransferase [Marinobacterium sp.]|nr:prenyltransferase [Marinobacterium sp.]
MTAAMDLRKYHFWRALRPFSFTVSLFACLTGIAVASSEGIVEPLRALLVVMAGVLLQAGVNLINDYADLPLLAEQGDIAHQAREQVRRNFQAGLGCFVLAALVAFYLIAQVGLPLLWVCIVGLAGALCYTLEPVNYKARGLGVVLVFWLMGVLMVCGSYMALAGELGQPVLLFAIPFSFLVSLLLLSNELRDYESDLCDGIGTLSVRLGYRWACRLYQLLLLLAWLTALVLDWQRFWPLLLVLPLVWTPLQLLDGAVAARRRLTPLTGRLLTAFSMVYCCCLMWG